MLQDDHKWWRKKDEDVDVLLEILLITKLI